MARLPGSKRLPKRFIKESFPRIWHWHLTNQSSREEITLENYTLLPWRFQSALQAHHCSESHSGPLRVLDYLMPEEGSLFRSCFQSRSQFCICNCFTLSQSLVLGSAGPSNSVLPISKSCMFFPGQCLSGHIYLSDSKGIYFKYPFISSPGKLPNSLLFPS